MDPTVVTEPLLTFNEDIVEVIDYHTTFKKQGSSLSSVLNNLS